MVPRREGTHKVRHLHTPALVLDAGRDGGDLKTTESLSLMESQ